MNTTYFLNLVAGNVFKTKTSPAIPTNYYIGLSTTTPSNTSSGISGVTEPPTSSGYSRIQLSSLSSPVNGVITNSADINWPESTANWGTITHYVVFDNATRASGNTLFYAPLSTSRTVEAGTIMSIRSGALNITVTNKIN